MSAVQDRTNDLTALERVRIWRIGLAEGAVMQLSVEMVDAVLVEVAALRSSRLRPLDLPREITDAAWAAIEPQIDAAMRTHWARTADATIRAEVAERVTARFHWILLIGAALSLTLNGWLGW